MIEYLKQQAEEAGIRIKEKEDYYIAYTFKDLTYSHNHPYCYIGVEEHLYGNRANGDSVDFYLNLTEAQEIEQADKLLKMYVVLYTYGETQQLTKEELNSTPIKVIAYMEPYDGALAGITFNRNKKQFQVA